MKIDKYYQQTGYSHTDYRYVRRKINRFLDMESLHSNINTEYVHRKKTVFRSRRDELVSLMTDGINSYRVGTKWKPVTKRYIAIQVNKNPAFTGNDGELELVYKDCIKKGSFAKFFWITNGRTCKENEDEI